MTIRTILNGKGTDVFTIDPGETIRALVGVLHERRVGAVVVSKDGRAVDGIISERDVVHGLDEHGVDLLDMPVSKMMTREVFTCVPDDSVDDVMGIMTQKRIRHLPVMDGAAMIGVVSIGDIVKSRMDEMAMEAEALKTYITG